MEDKNPTIHIPCGEDDFEVLYRAGVTDGLPVIPPTESRVEKMLAHGLWRASATLLEEPASGLSITAHQAAVCAVLSGAAPEYFSIIGTALLALGDTNFRLSGPLTSTGGAATMVVVSGPIARNLDINCREGVFGPGHRPNATIGRAIRLAQLLCLDAFPGKLDQSTQGWPGKYTLCFSENVDASPWAPFTRKLGYADASSTVSVFACLSGITISDHSTSPQALLHNIAEALKYLGTFSPGRSVVVLSPEHAERLAKMSRREIAEFVYDAASNDLATLKRHGKIENFPNEPDTDWSGSWLPYGDPRIYPGDENIRVRRGWSHDDILIIVGGGQAGGHSTFFPSWSRNRGVPLVTREIVL